MSIEMHLEGDARLTLEQARAILQAGGFAASAPAGHGFDAWHAASGTDVRFRVDAAPCALAAEGLLAPAWQRHAQIIFRYGRGESTAGLAATMQFVRALADASDAWFVLSFQFESVNAVKDARGYREIADPPSTMPAPVDII